MRFMYLCQKCFTCRYARPNMFWNLPAKPMGSPRVTPRWMLPRQRNATFSRSWLLHIGRLSARCVSVDDLGSAPGWASFGDLFASSKTRSRKRRDRSKRRCSDYEGSKLLVVIRFSLVSILNILCSQCGCAERTLSLHTLPH